MIASEPISPRSRRFAVLLAAEKLVDGVTTPVNLVVGEGTQFPNSKVAVHFFGEDKLRKYPDIDSFVFVKARRGRFYEYILTGHHFSVQWLDAQPVEPFTVEVIG